MKEMEQQKNAQIEATQEPQKDNNSEYVTKAQFGGFLNKLDEWFNRFQGLFTRREEQENNFDGLQTPVVRGEDGYNYHLAQQKRTLTLEEQVEAKRLSLLQERENLKTELQFANKDLHIINLDNFRNHQELRVLDFWAQYKEHPNFKNMPKEEFELLAQSRYTEMGILLATKANYYNDYLNKFVNPTLKRSLHVDSFIPDQMLFVAHQHALDLRRNGLA